ncbi:MAG: pyrimidine dimer DNA glycosylase/endonuclease V [Actinomycetota bacterium]
MNIFAVSADPADCARALDDRRLIKMVLETAQLLSAAVRARPDLQPGADPALFYRATHLNHPVALWVRQQPANFAWTKRLLDELLDEYSHRYGRVHACARIAAALGETGSHAPPVDWCNCTPFPELPTFDAYRATLAAKWAADSRPPSWRDRGPPAWFGGRTPEHPIPMV